METLYRSGLRTALAIRNTTGNEISYIESGQFPLECKIKKQQLNFWKTLLRQKNENPHTPLSKLMDYAIKLNVKYIAHYQKLSTLYSSPNDCQSKLQLQFRTNWKRKIDDRTSKDSNSKLAAYLQVNPQLSTPTCNKFELERIIATRYRTGSHNLRIETGRMRIPKTPREDRTCICENDVQTLDHCIISCPLVKDIRPAQFTSVSKAFETPHISQFLLEMEHILKIK